MRLVYNGKSYSRGCGPMNGHIYDAKIMKFDKFSTDYIKGYKYYVEYSVPGSVVSIKCKYKCIDVLMLEWKGIEKESVYAGKLVRDKIPEIIISNGDYPITEIIDEPNRLSKELTNKLLEECLEFSSSESVVELADIVEVVYAILASKNISIEEFEAIRFDKKFKRGGFKNCIYLKYISSDNQ